MVELTQKAMKIFLDFGGTVVENGSSLIERCNFGCVEVIRRLQDANHEIVVNTGYVGNKEVMYQVMKYLNEDLWMGLLPKNRDDDNCHPLPITQHTSAKILPYPWNWALMRVRKEIYIDDIAFEIPLKPQVMSKGTMVDWDEVARQFEVNGIIGTV